MPAVHSWVCTPRFGVPSAGACQEDGQLGHNLERMRGAYCQVLKAGSGLFRERKRGAAWLANNYNVVTGALRDANSGGAVGAVSGLCLGEAGGKPLCETPGPAGQEFSQATQCTGIDSLYVAGDGSPRIQDMDLGDGIPQLSCLDDDLKNPDRYVLLGVRSDGENVRAHCQRIVKNAWEEAPNWSTNANAGVPGQPPPNDWEGGPTTVWPDPNDHPDRWHGSALSVCRPGMVATGAGLWQSADSKWRSANEVLQAGGPSALRAFHGQPGLYCGSLGLGNAFCCPDDGRTVCRRTAYEYACSRRRDSTGLTVSLLCFFLLCCAVSNLMRRRRHRLPLAHQQGVVM